jgi:galactonate dehydratase
MYRHAFWRGGPILNSAISGVEQALWDILGKVTNQPVYQLLGGACRDRIRVYANGPRGNTPEELAESAQALVERGYTAMKFCPTEQVKVLDGQAVIRQAARTVEAVRRAVGPDVDLALDAHGRLSPAMAIQVAHAVRDYGIFFYEEPCTLSSSGKPVQSIRNRCLRPSLTAFGSSAVA